MVNNESKFGNFRENCYTCNKNHKVAKFVLKRNELYEIHYDMKRRPRLIVTPNEHIETLCQMDPILFGNIYREMVEFIESYGIQGFRFEINHKSWARHSHLHMKFEMEKDDIDKILNDLWSHNINYIKPTVCKKR